jgi:hypothetical protein
MNECCSEKIGSRREEKPFSIPDEVGPAAASFWCCALSEPTAEKEKDQRHSSPQYFLLVAKNIICQIDIYLYSQLLQSTVMDFN